MVPVAEIFELRWRVLRPGMPREAAVFPEDEEPAAFHIAAYDEAGAVQGCVTFFPEPLPENAGGTDGGGTEPTGTPAMPGTPTTPGASAAPGPAHRFRGMASAPGVRGLGYGKAVLRAGLAEAAARGAGPVWCNGRTPARGFYEHHGFNAVGPEFSLGSVGPHHLFVIEPGAGEAGRR